jgi:outer membrane protein
MSAWMHRTALAGMTLGALLATPPVRGAALATRTMTLSEALEYAHLHQPDLRAAAARVDVARAAADATRARWYPTLTGAAEVLATTTNNTTGSYLAVSGLDNPRVSSTPARSVATSSLEPAASSLIGLGLRQELFDFGRISAQAAADDLLVDATRLSAAGARLLVDDDIEEAYFAVYATQAVVSASESAFVRARVHRDQAKAGLDAGLRRPIEVTRAEAVLDRYDLGRIRAAHNVIIAQAVLAAAVGVPDRLLGISVTPPAPAALPSLDGAFELAEQNPDLRSAVLRIRAQERQTRAIAAETRPNLLLSGALSGNAGGAEPSSGSAAEAHGLVPLVPNWDVGLILAWPIVDETVRASVTRSRAQEQVRREEAASVHERLVAAVEEAYADVEAARDALPALRRALDAAIANYEQASARFSAGVGNAIEMADAEELRTSAEIELAQGTFEVARARARLGRFIAEAA